MICLPTGYPISALLRSFIKFNVGTDTLLFESDGLT